MCAQSFYNAIILLGFMASFDFLSDSNKVAFAVVIVVSIIAVCALFVSSLNKTERCVFEPGFACTRYVVDYNSLNLTLQNNYGFDVMIAFAEDYSGDCRADGGLHVSGESMTYFFENCTHKSSKVKLGIRYVGEKKNVTNSGFIVTSEKPKPARSFESLEANST